MYGFVDIDADINQLWLNQECGEASRLQLNWVVSYYLVRRVAVNTLASTDSLGGAHAIYPDLLCLSQIRSHVGKTQGDAHGLQLRRTVSSMRQPERRRASLL